MDAAKIAKIDTLLAARSQVAHVSVEPVTHSVVLHLHYDPHSTPPAAAIIEGLADEVPQAVIVPGAYTMHWAPAPDADVYYARVTVEYLLPGGV